MFSGLLSIPHAVLLGIVEGITEFLPVSSTGHLLVVGELIGFGTGEATGAADTYSIAIQFGAILAVLFLYRTGVSRSLVTLIAALAVGLSMSAAIEFSFLLGLITLSSATALDLTKHGSELVDQFGILAPAIGLLCAFVTAVIAVKWMVGYLESHSLRVFGWYRLAIGGVSVVLLATNVL